MKQIKSERLRKLESELNDLQQWLSLGLVPKKDVERHKEEMTILQARIEEEKERLQFLKEGGEAEEFIAPKRTQAKAGYNEMPTIPDVDMGDGGSSMSDGGYESDSYASNDTTMEDESEEENYGSGEHEGRKSEKGEAAGDGEEEEEDESYFSDRNRWKRGGIVDPDADEW